MIKLQNISFSYGINDECENYPKEEWGLRNINLEIKRGQVILLTGQSGCGKTTLLCLINGLIPNFINGVVEGDIFIEERNSNDITALERFSLIGTVFQDPKAQFFSVDTTNELAFGLENQGVAEDVIYKSIDKTVEKFSLEGLMDRNIFELSGGQKQKIACASIDVEDPPIILMDEPSSNLDNYSIEQIKEIICMWKKQGKTIIISEHRINYLFDIVDKMYLMKSGKIIDEFTATQMLELDDSNLVDMGLRSKNTENPINIELPNNSNKEFIGIKNLSVRRKIKKRTKDILNIKEMRLPLGEITAIVGDNGCGKTTLLQCLSGIERKCKGEITLRGKTYKSKNMRKVSYLVMQNVNHQLFAENVLEEVFISDIERNREKDLEILNNLDLGEYTSRNPMSLSGGQKQRVAIACAIASDAELLLFDEPTSGLDYANMMEVANQLKRLSKHGKTIVIVTHDSELIRACCHNIIRLFN